MTLFFTLSGFVIHLTYAKDFDERRFFTARFARLYPLYIVFLVLCFVGNPRLVTDGSDELLPFTLVHVLGVQTWLPFTYNGALAANGPFHVSWSISTEFFFYLCYPLLARYLRRIKNHFTDAVALSLVA